MPAPIDPETLAAEPLKFAYWVPNVSGGLVVSDIEQRTDWSYEYNTKLAVLAENNGFEYALSQVRYEASYGAEYQHRSSVGRPVRRQRRVGVVQGRVHPPGRTVARA